MSPIAWAQRPIRKYADFSGRAPRAEYWWYTLAIVVLAFILTNLELLIGLDGTVGPYGPLSLLLGLALFIPGLAVTVRRLHDTNRSGWWILIAVIPYVMVGYIVGSAQARGETASLGTLGLAGIVALIGGLTLLVFMLLPGTKGDNRFGPSP